MKQKLLILWLMLLAGAAGLRAAEAYAVLSTDNKTLTFYYDTQRASRTGTTYDMNTGTDRPGWLDHATSVTKVVFDPSFANARPTSCYEWFCRMSNLTSISGLNYLNTSSVTNMSCMFSQCTLLSTIDVSHFNTAQVEDMSGMFEQCAFATIDLSNFDTSNVINMMGMFLYDASLESLDISNFVIPDSTSNSFTTDVMFAHCTNLKTLVIPETAHKLKFGACYGVGTQSAPCALVYPDGFTPEKTATGDGWYQWKGGYFKDAVLEPYAVLSTDNKTLTFYYDAQRSSRTGTTYDMNTGSNTPGWSTNENCYTITRVVFDPSFANARPTSCCYWFYKMTALTSISGLNYLNTSEVTDMGAMFALCTGLTSLDVSHFNTSKVTSMKWMFGVCSKLKSLDLSSFNTANVKGENSGYDLMFNSCSALTCIDLSSFTFSSSASSTGMFNNCYLQTLIVPATAYNLDANACSNLGTQDEPCILIYPDGFTPETTATGDGWYQWKGGYFKDAEPEPYAVLSTDNKTLTFYYDKLRASRIGTAYDLDEGYWYEGCYFPVWHHYATSVTKVVFDSSFAIARPTSCAFWFDDMNNLTSISGLNYLNTSNVTSMEEMFRKCSSLSSLDVSGFDTGNVTDMECMFEGCTNLTSLDVSGFDTGNVKFMNYMFHNCSGLTSLDVSGFDTGNMIVMYAMFCGCANLTSLDVSGFDTEKVTRMDSMFSGCTNLSSLDLSSFTFNSGLSSPNFLRDALELKTLIIPATAGNLSVLACSGVGTQSAPCALIYPDGFTLETTATGDGWYQWKGGYFKDAVLEPYAVLTTDTLTFYYDTQRSSRTGTTYDLNTGINNPGWYSNRASVTNVVFDSFFADARPTSCCRWFFEMTNLTSITGMENLNTSSVTNMMGMFSYCTQLSTIDVSHFNTSQVEDMSGMFEQCAFTTIDLSNFDTSNVTNMMGMFLYDASLESLDISNFVIPDSTSFYGYGTNLMFVNCSNLKTLVVPMTAKNIKHGSFLGVGTQSTPCSLIYPDGFTLETTATGDGWYQWKSGYFKDAEPEPYAVLNDTTLTFYYDARRYARTGTTYDLNTGNYNPGWYSNRASVTNVVFDSSFAAARPVKCYGWFNQMTNLTSVTGIEYLNTSNVTSMAYMFYGCSHLTSLDVSGFDTGNVTSMACMFYNCYGLTSLDVSGFDTGDVTSMAYMFFGCANLASLDVSGFGTGKVIDMTYMFYCCSGLSSLDVSGFDTGNVKSMAYMFYNCYNLTSLDLSGFDTGNVTSMAFMFYGCRNLSGLDVSGFDTENVTTMVRMFTNCSSLTSLDVSSFNIPSDYTLGFVTNCSSLQTLVIPITAGRLNASACEGVGTQDAPCTLVYPSDFTLETTAEGDGWYQWKSGYFKDVEPEPYAVLDGTTLTFYYDKLSAERTGTSYALNTGDNNPKWYSKRASVTNVVFDSSFADARPTSCYRWFCYMNNLTSITGIEYLNTSNVTLMEYMFFGCRNLASLDLSGFDTGNVTDMTYMFSGCYNLTSLDLSVFDTGNVTKMVYMFYECSGLTSLDLSGFDTGNVTSMVSMFDGCSGLTSLDLSGFTFKSGRNTGYLLRNCTGLQTLSIPSTAGCLYANACMGVGTQSAPCVLVYPDGFPPEPTSTGDGWYKWKSGYFCDTSLLMGDVNHDGTVNITDVTLTVDKVLGRTPSPFFEENADVMVDGQVTVSDVTAIVNILLHQSASHAPATAREATMDRLWLTSDGGHCLLHLSTPERYTAMHLTLLLPEGGSMGNVRMSASRSAGHHAEMRPIGDGLYNIVLHASDNAELRDGETSLLSFDLAGCQPQDVEVVAIQSTNRLYETVMSAGMATGLEVVETDDAADGDTYNTVGVRVGKNARGVVIKNGGKTVRR